MPKRNILSNNPILFLLSAIIFILLHTIFPLDNRVYSLGDDFAQYIHHARNICLGLPYSELPYPFNPQSQIGPPAYPPVYPFLISPLACGPAPNIFGMKALSLLMFCLALPILFKIFQSLKYASLGLETLVIFSLLPWIFFDAGYLGSDTPYACFSFLVLWSLITLPDNRPAWIHSTITGLLIAVSTLTRDTGIALGAAGLLYLGQKYRKNPAARSIYLKQGGLLSLAFVLPLISWKLYEHYLGLGPANLIYFKTALGLDDLSIIGLGARLISNFYYYLTKSSELLFPLSPLIQTIPYLNWLRIPITCLILVILGWQFYKSFRGPASAIVLYLGCYFGIFMILDFHISKNGSRMLIPLAPWLVFFILKGFHEISEKNSRVFSPLSFRILVFIWLSLNIGGTFYFISSLRDPQSLSFSPQGASYQAMTEFIRRETPQIGRIAYIKPRYLSLYTNRQTIIAPFMGPPALTGPPSKVLAHLSHWKVNYILLDNHFVKEEEVLRKTMDQFPECFSLYYSSAPLTLFQFQLKK
jgi:hypothetical protein